MNEILTPPNITFAIGILAILFSVYIYFHKPQEDTEKWQAVQDEKESTRDEKVDSKAAILRAQLETLKEVYELRFKGVEALAVGAGTRADNHINSLEVKMDGVTNTINVLTSQVVELRTIINERIPKIK